MHVGVNMTNKNIFIFDSSDLHIQENLRPDNIKFIFKSADIENGGGVIIPPPFIKDPNTFYIDFDKSDLRIEDDLISTDIRVYFGEDDSIQPKCDNFWKDVNGDNVSIDCTCLTLWEENDGGATDLILDCVDDKISCDVFWKDVLPGQGVNFDCGCIEENRDSNDFIIDCESGDDGGEVGTSILGQFTTSVGESVRYDIHGLEIYNTNVGEILTGDIFTNRTILDNIVAVDGSELYAQLYRDRELSFQAYAGENFTQNILFSAIAKLDPIIEVGESLSVSLSTQYSFSYTIDVGESLEAVVKYYPTYNIDAFVDVGEAASAVLSISRNLNANITSGETQVVDIKFASNDNLSPTIDVGENLEFTLNSDILITDVSVDVGETTIVGLITYPSANIGFSTIGGEYVYTSVSFIPTLNPVIVDAGETLTSTFNTYPYYRLNPESMQSGENLDSFKLTGTLYATPSVDVGEDVDVNIEFDPYQGVPITVTADGESVEFNLFRNRLLYPNMIEVGEDVTASIQDYASAKFVSATTAGETLSINLSADVYIGTFNAIDGQLMLKPTLDSLDNYVVNTGENLDVSFAVDTTLPVDINVGESISFELKRGEPASLPFTVISGEAMKVEVRSLRSVDFSVSFTVGNRVYAEDWINEPFSIDLDNRGCCDKVASSGLLRVELDDAPYNSTRYDATISMCEVMTFDLSVRRTLSFNAHNGESLEYDTDINEMSFECFDGQYAIVPSLRTLSIVDLEDGNTIPENPVIDVNRPDIPNNFNYIGIYSGEAMSLNLSYTQSVKMSIGVGETFSSDIVTNPPFYFGIYAGEYMYSSLSTDIKLKGSFEMGERVTSAFYEPDYNGASGEELHFDLDTKDDYYAEFTIDGCLDNKYADIDPESGQPLPNEYNGTSVEGEMFSAYATGRCF